MSLLHSHYETGAFFDEMFVPTPDQGGVRPHYRRLAERLGTLSQTEFDQRRAAVDLLTRGVHFGHRAACLADLALCGTLVLLARTGQRHVVLGAGGAGQFA